MCHVRIYSRMYYVLSIEILYMLICMGGSFNVRYTYYVFITLILIYVLNMHVENRLMYYIHTMSLLH